MDVNLDVLLLKEMFNKFIYEEQEDMIMRIFLLYIKQKE